MRIFFFSIRCPVGSSHILCHNSHSPLFSPQCFIPIPYIPLYWKTLRTSILPFLLLLLLPPPPLYFFTPLGCNTVSFVRNGPGEKDSIPEFSLPPPLLTCSQTLYINFHFTSLHYSRLSSIFFSSIRHLF